ncbi:MAG: TRAP transporter substrate-binding protein [Clostridiales bacterium]|nr:TRAP transporter substrate-binding protein [Clostridiales bacterium]
MKKIVAILLCAFLTCAMGTAALAAPEFTIRMGYISPELTPDVNNETMYAYTFRDYVQEKSEGRIAVEIYPAGQLGKFPEMIEGCMSGTVDMAIVNVIPVNSFYKPSMIFGLPGVFTDMDECTKVLQGEWGQAFNESMRQALGIRVLNHWSSGMRNFTNSVRELRVPSDAKGLTFRVMESPVSIKMVEALGAKAVPIASSEMYVAMQNHVVDGQENPISSIIQDLTYEVQKYCILDGHFTSSMMLIMNDALFQRMSPDLQQIILDGSAKGYEEASVVLKRIEADGIKLLEEKGMQVYQPTDEEKSQWHSVMFEATNAYIRETLGDELVDGFLAAIETVRNAK